MDPWSSFASSSSAEPASTSAWALGDVIPDWSDTAPAHSRSVLGNVDVKRVQTSVNDNQPTAEDNESDPWATAVSPPPDAFRPIVSPERKISPQKEVPDVPLTVSESIPGQAEVNKVAMEGAKLHRSPIGDASKHEKHVANIISTQAKSSPELVSHDINTSPGDMDNVVEEPIQPNILEEQQSDTNTDGAKEGELEFTEGLRESMVPQQVIETTGTSSGERVDQAQVGAQEEVNYTETKAEQDLGDNADQNADTAAKPNDPSDHTLIETLTERHDEVPEKMLGPTDSKPQDEWKTSQSSRIIPAPDISRPVSLFAEPDGLSADSSDDFAFSNPFAPEPEKAPRSTNELLPDIFPMPTVIDSDRDSIANYFSDSQVAPTLLSFGRARKLSGMLTRPTRQFFTPTTRVSTPPRPSSPASSINTSSSQSVDDGIRVKWKHTEIQARVQSVIGEWKNKRKDIIGMFDWDNVDVQGPSSPTHFVGIESMTTAPAMDRGPSDGPMLASPRFKRMTSSGPASAKTEAPDISFSWHDDAGSGVWVSAPSSFSPVQAPVQPVFNQIPITPSMPSTALQPTMTSQSLSGPATITQEDDSVDDWGDFTESESAPIPIHRPKLQLDTETTSFGDDFADDIWGPKPVMNGSASAQPAQLSPKKSSQLGSPTKTATDGLSIEPLQPRQPTFASGQLLQPTSVAPTTSTVATIEDNDDWGDMMGTPAVPGLQGPTPDINDDLGAPQPDQAPQPTQETELRPSITSRSSSSHHSSNYEVHAHTHPRVVHHHHHQPKHMSAIYIPPPKPSSPASSMYLSSSSSSSASSTTDVRPTIHVEGTVSRHGTMMLSPTAPKLTDAKMREDQIVRKIVESIPDIEYLID
ncbi:hypothetical protein V1508DRAFT_383551 [Lipomyces doorenjongii]|uniref:uncharacterized protein n=1 Tax=Lipomyces doorenjongii TaxID=383834 RepID=UPI0034CEBB47